MTIDYIYELFLCCQVLISKKLASFIYPYQNPASNGKHLFMFYFEIGLWRQFSWRLRAYKIFWNVLKSRSICKSKIKLCFLSKYINSIWVYEKHNQINHSMTEDPMEAAQMMMLSHSQQEYYLTSPWGPPLGGAEAFKKSL